MSKRQAKTPALDGVYRVAPLNWRRESNYTTRYIAHTVFGEIHVENIARLYADNYEGVKPLPSERWQWSCVIAEYHAENRGRAPTKAEAIAAATAWYADRLSSALIQA